jgi:hypothetical protein
MGSLLANPHYGIETTCMTWYFQFVAMTAALFLSSAGILRGQAVIEPPFGLLWGDSPEKLITWASRHTLDVTICLLGDQPALRLLKIQPRKGLLPDSQAAAVEARFLSGKLYELTVHYLDTEASADLMETRFVAMRKQVIHEYGPLLTNQQQRTVDDQFVTRTQSFHREPVKGLFLLLAFTEVEDLPRKTKVARFSMIYRNDNYRNQLETELSNSKLKNRE